MATEYTKIAGGTVYDPANGIDGEVRDIWILGQKIVTAPADPEVRATRVIDARGLVVMPGGVDMHCHIVGPKVNAARKMCPEQKRRGEHIHRTRISHSGTVGHVPSTFATGYKYAGMGYTTAFDAAIPPLSARHAHEEFHDTPCIDKGFYILVGNNQYLMRSIQQGEQQKVKALIGWLLGSAKSYAAKLVNPGGVEVWKNHPSGNVANIDSPVDHFGVTPRQIIRSVAQAVDELKLPHPGAHPRQQPGPSRQLVDDARDHEGARGAPRAHDPHPVSQLWRRNRRRRLVLVEGGAPGRIRQRSSQYHGRRRTGDVRRDHQHDG